MNQFWTVIDNYTSGSFFTTTMASVCGSFVVLRTYTTGDSETTSESLTTIPFESPLDAQIWIDEEVKAMKGEK